MEKHARFSGGNRPEEGSADDQRDRQFAAHLDRNYDEVISHRLASKGLGGRVVGVETVEKMTVPHIAAKVRQHFRKQ